MKSLLITAAVILIAQAQSLASSAQSLAPSDTQSNLIIMNSYGNETFMIDDYPELECLAKNIYFEARGSSLADKYAVADVVLNRVYDTRYPNSICDVIQQGQQKPSWKNPDKMVMVRNKCQFSWYCDGKADDPVEEDRWLESQSIAWNIFYHHKYRGISEGSTHYHATYVNPSWASTLQLVGRIGAHVYYRWEL